AATRTVPVAIAGFTGIDDEVPWGEVSAAAVTVTRPLIVLAILFQRRIVQGLTAGAIKAEEGNVPKTVGIIAALDTKAEEARLIRIGGSAGTAIATSAMRALPVGVPKLMVSTVASGDTRAYVGNKDVTMMYSVVDVAGINRLSARILTNAAGAICGMVEAEPPPSEERPIIAASMFGNTTPLV